MKKIILLAILAFASSGYGQTLKNLSYNTTNGQVVYSGSNTMTFTSPFTFSTSGLAAQVRTNIGLGAGWLTNTNQASFRADIGLGSAATNSASAFQPASSVLTNLASSNGAALTNISISGVVGLQSNLDTKIATNGNGAGLTNLTASNIVGTVSLASNVSGIVALINGGTGSTNASTARAAISAASATNNFEAADKSYSLIENDGGNAVLWYDELSGDHWNITNPNDFRTDLGLGATWLTNTNQASFRTAIGLDSAATNPASAFQPASSALTNLSSNNAINLTNFPSLLLRTNGSAASLTNFPTLNQNTTGTASNVTGVVAISNGGTGATNASNARTNLELGETNNVTFSNVTANGIVVANSFVTASPVSLALDTTQTAAGTNGVLDLPLTANVLRITNTNSISAISNGRLGAFYYIINQSGGNLTISNSATITTRGGGNIVLATNQSATLLSTTGTNATIQGGPSQLDSPTFSNVTTSGTLTATGNVTMSGTANTAPNQTAASGSSVMTRDLGDLRLFGQLALLDQMRSDMGAVYATNGGGGSVDVNGFDLTTSTNSASSSLYQGYFGSKQTSLGTQGNTAWTTRVVAAWAFNRYNTNVEVRMQFGRNISVTTHGPLDERGMGIRVNGNNMYFETHDGTNHYETTNAVTLTHATGPDVFWAVAESGVARFYRGQDTLLATVTNNVPTTASLGAQRWVISISNTSTVSSGFRVRANPGFILQQ